MGTERSDVGTEMLELKVKEYASAKIKTENSKIIPIFLFFVFLSGMFFFAKLLNGLIFYSN
jgi:hypothetical protein